MIDFIAAGIGLLLVSLACAYIVKAKKRGVKCIGCPAGGQCSGHCGCCGHTDACRAAERESDVSDRSDAGTQRRCGRTQAASRTESSADWF